MSKKVIVIAALFILLPGFSLGAENPYGAYFARDKRVTEFEWRLVQVNLKLGEIGFFVTFDHKKNIFRVKKFVDTRTLLKNPPAETRDLLLSQCSLVEAVLSSEFREFKSRKVSDLKISFVIGESRARKFAAYEHGRFFFASHFYDFRRENGL